MSEPFRLAVLAPAETLLAVERVTRVRAQLADGAPLSIHPGHAPLLAETVPAPLRYIDALGEHTIDLDAGILQVTSAGVTVFAGKAKPSEGSEPSRDLEGDAHFDRLTRELLSKLNAQTDGVLDTEHQMEETEREN